MRSPTSGAESLSKSLRGYALGLLLIAVAGVATGLMRGSTGVASPVAAYLGAILLVGWYAGTGPVVLATVLAVVLDVWPPGPEVGLAGWLPTPRTGWFVVFALGSAWFGTERRRVTRHLVAARDRLEDEVRNRTSDLRRTMAHLDEAQRLTGIGSWACPVDGTDSMLWSEGLFHILGADPLVVRPSQESLDASLHPDDRRRRQALVNAAIRDCEPFEVEYRIVRPDGVVRFIRCTGQPLLDDSGTAIEYVGALLDMTERRGGQRALRRAREQAVRAGFEATLAERSRIAREMHDTLLQGFAGVALTLVAVANRMTDAPESELEIREVIRSAQRTLEEARQAIFDLHQPTEGYVLADSLREAAEEVLRPTGMTLQFRCTGQRRPLTPLAEYAIGRVAGEAVVNAATHSGGYIVRLHLDYRDGAVRLAVTDDGCGFWSDRPSAQGHWGIRGMRERAGDLGGRLRVRSAPGEGTKVELVVPTR